MLQEFRLPDLGEGLTESEVVAWRVAVGDHIELNQVIADIETAKAVVELPSPFAGTVAALHAEAGQTIDVGAPLLSFDIGGDAPGGAAEGNVASGASDDTASRMDAASGEVGTAGDSEAPEPNLVGYGAKTESTARRRKRGGVAASAAPVAVAESAGSAAVAAHAAPVAESAELAAVASSTTHERPRSTPPVRKLARDLGVDLAGIHGTGVNGRIVRTDVLANTSGPSASGSDAAAPADASAPAHATSTRVGATSAARPDAASTAPTDDVRITIKGVRKATAAAMVASAFTAPHVTEFLTIDVTPTMEFLERLKADRAFESHRMTLLTICAKAVCIGLTRTPALNSSWDDAAQEIVQFGSINLGIAAATQRGLVVPNIKGAGRMTLGELADALGELTSKAREGATQPADLRGGTFTITNIGVFGIDAGTPILNPGEAGILALGAVRTMPWEYQGTIALRQVLTLSLSFDHRVVDGAEGSRFLADVGAILRDPARVLALV